MVQMIMLILIDHSTFEVTDVTLSVWIYYDSGGTYDTHLLYLVEKVKQILPYKLRIYNSGVNIQ